MERIPIKNISTLFCRASRILFGEEDVDSLLSYQYILFIGNMSGGFIMKNTSVSLGNHYSEFVNAQVQAGRYGSASEVLRAGLRLLEEQEIRLRALQAALIAGEESGTPAAFDSEAFLKRMRDNHVR